MHLTKLLLCIVIAQIGFTSLQAQNWNIGTQWIYTRELTVSPYLQVNTIEALDTATIDGKFGFKIDPPCASYLEPDYIAYENRIMHYHFDTLGWFKLYNFNLEVGEQDTAYVPYFYNPDPGLSNSFVYSVDSIDYLPLSNGEQLKVLHITHQSLDVSSVNYASFIIEGIGSNECMIPTYALLGSPWGEFSCFEMNGETLYSSSDKTCAELTPVSEAFKTAYEAKVFPNPNQGHFFVETNALQNLNFTIHSPMGKVIKNGTFESGSGFVDLENESKGLYFITLFGEKGLVQLPLLIQR